MQKERPASSSSGVTARKPNGGLFRRVTPITPQQAFEAVQLGDSSSIVNLLHSGAHPDSIRTSNGATALTVAIINQNRILVEQLLELGANPNLSRDPSYLHLAVARADNRHTLDILQALLRAGANPSSQEGHYSRSPLHQAILLGRVIAAKKLISSGADVNAMDGRAQSPLALALRQPPFIREAFCCLLSAANARLRALTDPQAALSPSNAPLTFTPQNRSFISASPSNASDLCSLTPSPNELSAVNNISAVNTMSAINTESLEQAFERLNHEPPHGLIPQINPKTNPGSANFPSSSLGASKAALSNPLSKKAWSAPLPGAPKTRRALSLKRAREMSGAIEAQERRFIAECLIDPSAPQDI